jgi:precorrin-6B methylase 1
MPDDTRSAHRDLYHVANTADLPALTVVGTGLIPWKHMTLEALDAIERADKVHFVVADIMMERWLQDLNPTAERLAEYLPDRPRHESYRIWTDTVLESVRAGLRTCAVSYGHPGVFVQFTRNAIRQARGEGYSAVMLPGISSEDCLFCDLGMDPGPLGLQSYGATVFVERRPLFDTGTPLILWQITVASNHGPPIGTDRAGLNLLTKVLLEWYPPEHLVVVYEGSRNPAVEPIIQTIALSRLATVRMRRSGTLFVPPL